MKRDILDDYRDFLMAVRDRMKFELRPRRACLDKDGDILQEMVMKVIIPGVGVTHGTGVVWIPPILFPHGDYDEPCDTEMTFYQPCEEDEEADLDHEFPPYPEENDPYWAENDAAAQAKSDPFMDEGFIEYLNGLLSEGNLL